MSAALSPLPAELLALVAPARLDEPLQSPEGTWAGSLPADGLERLQEGNTAILLLRLAPSQGYVPADPGRPEAPFGWYRGHAIIGSGAPIDRGVYLGRKPREAIVVDLLRRGSRLGRAYAELIERVQTAVEAEQGRRPRPDAVVRGMQRRFQEELLPLMRDIVERELPYDEATVQRLTRAGRLRPDELVDLDLFLQERGGVCRHQVLLVGALIERLVVDGWLQGRVSIERKHVAGFFSHAWVRFEGLGDEVLILDPAQRVFAAWTSLQDGSRLLYQKELAPKS